MAAHVVSVFQHTGNDVGNDFHIVMWMQIESLSDSDTILVDDTQRTESHETRIVILRK